MPPPPAGVELQLQDMINRISEFITVDPFGKVVVERLAALPPGERELTEIDIL
jgi:hypothetical protein